MSAQLIYDNAPLGAIIRYCDGAPRPAERHRRKLHAWERHNNTGRLIKRQAVIVLRVFKSIPVVERPAAGSILVLDRPGDVGELVHVAQDRQASDEWLSRHGYPNAVLHASADEIAAMGTGEGRAA
ncbi:hypothetical protein [Hoeflea sp.]|uniref:hypothetical protein n=1 Tax=Hoeflea sp. TaxID=1940281 RepID=UPI003B01E76B